MCILLLFYYCFLVVLLCLYTCKPLWGPFIPVDQKTACKLYKYIIEKSGPWKTPLKDISCIGKQQMPSVFILDIYRERRCQTSGHGYIFGLLYTVLVCGVVWLPCHTVNIWLLQVKCMTSDITNMTREPPTQEQLSGHKGVTYHFLTYRTVEMDTAIS